MTVSIRVGHVLDKLAELPERSVQVCVTSPPYYGLRSYGTEPQTWGGDGSCGDGGHEWGEEATRVVQQQSVAHGGQFGPKATAPNRPRTVVPTTSRRTSRSRKGTLPPLPRLARRTGQEPTLRSPWLGHRRRRVRLRRRHITEVFRAVKRVLRDDGCLFVNLGDSYAGGKIGNTNGTGATTLGRWQGEAQAQWARRHGEAVSTANASLRKAVPVGLKPKDLMGVPWRVAFALQADGWYLRNDLIWAKTACMPESVTDRATRSHEFIFHFSKSARYFYDAEAVKEAVSDASDFGTDRPAIPMASSFGHHRSRLGNGSVGTRRPQPAHRLDHRPRAVSRQPLCRDAHGNPPPRHPRRHQREGVLRGVRHPLAAGRWPSMRRVRGTGADTGEVVSGVRPHSGLEARSDDARREMLSTDWSTPGIGTPRLPGGFVNHTETTGSTPGCTCFGQWQEITEPNPLYQPGDEFVPATITRRVYVPGPDDPPPVPCPGARSVFGLGNFVVGRRPPGPRWHRHRAFAHLRKTRGGQDSRRRPPLRRPGGVLMPDGLGTCRAAARP